MCLSSMQNWSPKEKLYIWEHSLCYQHETSGERDKEGEKNNPSKLPLTH